MKKVVLFCLMAMFIGMQTPAVASQWIVSQNGEVDVQGLSQVSFDIIYDNSDVWFQAASWDIDLQLDITELTPVFNPDPPSPPDFIPYGYAVDYSYEDLVGSSFGPASTDRGVLNGDIFSIAGLSFDDVWIAPGQNTMASITFDILKPDVANGSVEADILVLAQNPGPPAKGFVQPPPLGVIRVDTDSTLNADIVGQVPLPGAAWLLCSGLLGLVGIRRWKR